MPTRHGLNNTARGYFTKHEIEKMGYGTQKRRLGADSQLVFGDCALSLNAAIDPVVSPSGTIYSREAIMKYLLTKTTELKRAKKLYKQAVAEQEQEEAAETQKQIQKVKDTFVAREKGAALVPERAAVFVTDAEHTKKVAREKLVAKLAEAVDTTTKAERQEQIRKSAFWLPEHAPGHRKRKLEKPPKRPASPLSGKPLKLAQLVPINLQRSETGKPLCAVSQKEINYNEAVVIVPSGAVMLKEHFETMAKKSGKCPVSGKAFDATKDVIYLRKAASGNAASGQVVAEHWTPCVK